MIEVKKVWGKEIWIANFPEYCGKLLCIDKNAQSSLHYHIKKMETFFCIKGTVCLFANGIYNIITPNTDPVTIMPGDHHRFVNLGDDAMLMEVSTFHSDEDVVRLEPSKKGDS